MMNIAFSKARASGGIRRALMVSSCMVVLSAASAAGAQTATTQQPADAQEVGDIVVTALRRDTTLQKTPLSITAVRGDTLSNANISDSTDLVKVAPGLTFAANSDGGSRIVLRNIQAAGEPTVGLYYGETPLTSPLGNNNDAGEATPNVRLFDVERVEVLRGPQGTLYGSSSMAGTVRLLFNNPNLTDYEGKVAGQAMTVDHGGTGYEVQGVVNTPLVKDILAVRVVGFYTDAPGWVDYPVLGKKNLNTTKSRGGRAMLRFQPMENLTLDGMAVIQDATGNNANWRYNTYRDGTGPAYVQPLRSTQPQSDKLRLYTGNLKWDLDDFAIVGNVSWLRRNRGYNWDSSDFLNRFYPGAPLVNVVRQRVRSETQELRASSTTESPLQWTVGGFHSLREETSSSLIKAADATTGEVVFPATVAAGTLIYDRRINSRLEQTAGYADLSYKLFDALTLNAGARYYDYKVTVGGSIPIGLTRINIRPSPYSEGKGSDNGWLYKFNVSYQATPDLLVYALASSGFRPGGANQALGLPAALVPYKGDSMWNYEAGVKSSWLDHAITANFDIFHIDWKNLQSTGFDPSGIFNIVTNAGTVGVDGIEGDLAIRPVRGLTLTASGSYIVSKLKGNQNVPGGFTITGAGLKDDNVPRTPRTTAQAAAQYDWDVSSSLQGIVRADVSYQSTQWMFFRRTDAATQRVPGFATVGAKIGIGNEDAGWHVDAFVTNLFDKVGILRIDNTTLNGGPTAIRATSIAPRTIGMSFSKSF
ncbi:TonB-dependent receptor [Sphingomonas crocodyli]|nr:TonB-dependent receptor [Sphingomonas crocodyli]